MINKKSYSNMNEGGKAGGQTESWCSAVHRHKNIGGEVGSVNVKSITRCLRHHQITFLATKMKAKYCILWTDRQCSETMRPTKFMYWRGLNEKITSINNRNFPKIIRLEIAHYSFSFALSYQNAHQTKKLLLYEFVKPVVKAVKIRRKLVQIETMY